jgi:hypothetical protein
MNYVVKYDPSIPIFSNYWDNSYTFNDSGTALFNVTVANTNGTVVLNINSQNYRATNLTNNVYNVSANSTTGTYNYYWFSYGNGTNKNYNSSETRSYVVNGSQVLSSKLINHTSLSEFNNITSQDMDKIRNLSILFGHQSVGRNIMNGLIDLRNQNSTYNLTITPSDLNADVTSANYDSGNIFGHQNSGSNGDPDSKNNEFFNFLNNNTQKIDVAFLKYCYVDVMNSPASLNAQNVFDNYKTLADSFKTENSNVTLVHFTAALMVNTTSSLDNYQRNLYRQLIINEYSGSDYIFDLSDLESYRNGSYSTFVYNGTTYLSLDSYYTSDGGHPDSNDADQMIAKALLVLLKKVAEENSS